MEYLKNVKQKILLLLAFFSSALIADPTALLVSDREHFDDPDRLSLHQVKRYLSLKTPTNPREVKGEDWLDHLEGSRVAILIHGYNNTYQDALDFFVHIINNTPDLYDHYICYLWPGGDSFWEYEQARTIVTGDILPQRLSATLENISVKSARFDIISHSMGCRLALEALNRTRKGNIHNLFMFAPAVDDEAIEKGERYSTAIQNTSKSYVFYSRFDPVENIIYPLAEWDLALGAIGPEDPTDISNKIRCIDCSQCIDDHSGYLTSPFVFRVIKDVIENKF